MHAAHGELLRGIRQIKAAAWERCFVSRVSSRVSRIWGPGLVTSIL